MYVNEFRRRRGLGEGDESNNAVNPAPLSELQEFLIAGGGALTEADYVQAIRVAGGNAIIDGGDIVVLQPPPGATREAPLTPAAPVMLIAPPVVPAPPPIIEDDRVRAPPSQDYDSVTPSNPTGSGAARNPPTTGIPVWGLPATQPGSRVPWMTETIVPSREEFDEFEPGTPIRGQTEADATNKSWLAWAAVGAALLLGS